MLRSSITAPHHHTIPKTKLIAMLLFLFSGKVDIQSLSKRSARSQHPRQAGQTRKLCQRAGSGLARSLATGAGGRPRVRWIGRRIDDAPESERLLLQFPHPRFVLVCVAHGGEVLQISETERVQLDVVWRRRRRDPALCESLQGALKLSFFLDKQRGSLRGAWRDRGRGSGDGCRCGTIR
ncbi:hypothetical protein BC830DRAFT_1145827 [Chytriomyces sp. MP71]|nr:hypothetical protein BC830DRAFT_1145827 [Chytriomyces sp. MP71]